MSATIETIITCDLGLSGECEGTYIDGDSRNESAALQRSTYSNAGWKWKKQKDCCPKCLEELKKKNSNG